MSPTDARAAAGSVPFTDVDAVADTRPRPGEYGVGSGIDTEDTLDLRLPEGLLALFETGRSEANQPEANQPEASQPVAGGHEQRSRGDSTEPLTSPTPTRDDLLDGLADWGPTATPAGVFQLVPVRVERDLPLVCRWMNDPAIVAFWELAGPQTVTEDHLLSQLTGDGRSIPCLGVLEGTPMSYWEIYRADLDPLARHYPARPHDTGIHLLIGAAADRGRGLGRALLRAVADLVLDKRPACARVVAEPDLRNIPSVTAFLRAGFRFSDEVDLPDKRAALMIRDRFLRDPL